MLYLIKLEYVQERQKYSIEGSSKQKHLVQSLCSTVPEQASPLLQPEVI